jgi:pimeloyl-ACP methyl ester carboxylesterase
MTELEHVTSKDGTSIAYERAGSGPALVLVGGGAVDRSENAPLGPELAEHFTVYNYDRRGRGDSRDTAPYALERELEDLAALIDVAGGSAHVFGASSGGALALEAAVAGLPIGKLAVYEVPYMTGEVMQQRWREYVARLGELLAQGRRGDAFELFMRMAGSPEEQITGAKASPYWPGCEAIAHTLAYDAACVGDGPPPTDRLEQVMQPALVITGGGNEFFEQAADAILNSVPRAERHVLAGAGHAVDAKALAPVLYDFLR